MVGDPHALTMWDNLESAVEYATERHPGASLYNIVAQGAHSDGTIDLREVSSLWTYQFQSVPHADGTVDQIAVSYGGRYFQDQGIYYATGGYQPVGVFDEADWRRFVDSPVLTSSFLSEANCSPLSAGLSDIISYSGSPGMYSFGVSNADGESVIGDPFTGEVTLASCSQ